MKKEFAHTVESLPTGIMTCFVDGEETGVLNFSPFHIRIRVPGKFSEKIQRIKLVYYLCKKQIYEEYEFEKFFEDEVAETEFWWEYCITIEDDFYQSLFWTIVRQYYEYIVMKSEAYDNSFSKKIMGYPAEKDIYFDADFAAWKDRQMRKIAESRLIEIIDSLNVEIAFSLENLQGYEMFLNEKPYSEEDATEYNSINDRILKKSARLYIGNSYCHNLFPEKEMLFRLMRKAVKEQKQITLVFTYLREEFLETAERLIEEIYQWCRENSVSLEILVNDWGMFQMLYGKEDCFTICYGTLLNRRRKDPRYQYKNDTEEKWRFLEENALNMDMFLEFLIEQGITRLEYESSGYPLKLPIFAENGRMHDLDAQKNNSRNKISKIKGISMHLPLYQTNTSQFCTLYALCKNQDRGKQEFIRNCPKYCSSYVCMYPQHLQMIGKYNSLFAVDEYLLKHSEILTEYIKAGVDRIVWNLV